MQTKNCIAFARIFCEKKKTQLKQFYEIDPEKLFSDQKIAILLVPTMLCWDRCGEYSLNIIQYFSRVVSLVVVELILNTTNKKEAIELQDNLAKLLWHGESEGTPRPE